MKLTWFFLDSSQNEIHFEVVAFENIPIFNLKFNFNIQFLGDKISKHSKNVNT